MSEPIIIAIITLLGIPVSLTIGWLINRKRNIGEVYKTITDSSQSAVEIMQAAMERLSIELNEATGEIAQLKAELVQLRQQNLLLLQENHTLHAKIDSLVKIVDTGELPLLERPASDPAS